MNIKNISRLPDEIRGSVTSCVEVFLAVHKDNVRSVFVYGSAAGREYIHRVSDVNLAFVFRELPFDTFQNSLRIVSRGLKKRISAPLFLNEEMIRSSLDIFPMEYLEMKENSVVLYGEDVFSSLEINGKHLRLFCEREIKGKLIRLQQAFLEAGLQQRKLKDLLRDVVKSLMPTFRALIRLKGQRPSYERKKDAAAMARLFGLNEVLFSSLHDKISRSHSLKSEEALSLLKDFWREIKKLSEEIDAL